MTVVYCSSDKYAEVFSASVTSLFEASKEAEELTVYLLDNGIREETKEKIRQIGREYEREIILIPMLASEVLAGVNMDFPKGFDLSTFGRLFLVSHLPKTIDKILYLDCDTIVLKPLTELWNIDISDYYAGMADDGHSFAYRKVLGLKTRGKYFSSGIMLVNLKVWRESNIEASFVNYIKERGGYVPIVDQGVLNAVLDGKILCLPIKFNVYTVLIAFRYRELLKIRNLKNFYSEQEVQAALKDPVVVHYMSNFFMPVRPWEKGCTNPYRDNYLNYKALTPWRDSPLWDVDNTGLKAWYASFCHVIPRPIAIWLSMVLYEIYVPMTFQLKTWRHRGF